MTSIRLKSVLAKNIRDLRDAKRISQEELSERADISATYMGMIEAGLRNPSFKIIERIAEALDVEAPKLFEVKDLSSRSPSSKVKDGIKVLFNEFVRDALEEIANQE